MADRIGVINKGELILVEDKAELMRKLGRKQLTLQLSAPLAAGAARARRLRARAVRRRRRADLHLRHAERARRHRHAAEGPGRRSASPSRTCTRRRARSKTSSSACSKDGAHDHEPARRPRHLPLRDGAHLAHADAEHRLAGDLDVAVLHRLRRGDRLAHPGGRRRQLRRLHRAGPDHAVAADAEHLERVVRHLLPEVHRHDLRAAVGAGLGLRDRAELRRRGGHQVDPPRARSSWPRRGCSCRCASSTRSGCCSSWC